MAGLQGHRATPHLARRVGRRDLLVHPFVQRDDPDRARARPAQYGTNLHLVDLQADRIIANALCADDAAYSADHCAIDCCRDEPPGVKPIRCLCLTNTAPCLASPEGASLTAILSRATSCRGSSRAGIQSILLAVCEPSCTPRQAAIRP